MADENDDTGTGDDITQEELEQQAQQAVEDGRAMQKITQLLQDNYDQREQLRNLREQMPDDDQVVLDADQAERLQEVGALGEDGDVQAESLEERLSEAEEAQQELQALRRKEKRREVYEATGLNAEAAEDILPDDVEYETETVDTEDGEETKAFVKTDDGRQEVGEYVEESYSDPIQNALYAESGEGGGEEGGGAQLARCGDLADMIDEDGEHRREHEQDAFVFLLHISIYAGDCINCYGLRAAPSTTAPADVALNVGEVRRDAVDLLAEFLFDFLIRLVNSRLNLTKETVGVDAYLNLRAGGRFDVVLDGCRPAWVRRPDLPAECLERPPRRCPGARERLARARRGFAG